MPFRKQILLPAALANGTAVKVLDGPPADYVDNLTFSFPTAPAAAVFTLIVSNMVCATWQGPTPWGPLLISNDETLEIDASGLVAGQVYAGIMAGSRHPADAVPPTAPQFGPSVVAVTNLPGTTLQTGGSGPTFPVGTGVDGIATISSNTTLTRPFNYQQLTVSASVLVNTAGFVIYCIGTLTNNGQIACNAGTGSPATPAPSGTNYGGGAGGAAGTNGSSPPGGTAQGGGGGATASWTGGTTTPATPGALSIAGLTAYTYGGGAGGAGSSPVAGGGGGGVLMIFCGGLTGTGSFTANGGEGGSASPPGAGGGGGLVIICYGSSLFTVTATAAGGPAGSGSGSPQNPGVAGQVALIQGTPS